MPLPPYNGVVTQCIMEKEAYGRVWANVYYFLNDVVDSTSIHTDLYNAEKVIHLTSVSFRRCVYTAGNFIVRFRDPDASGPKTGRRIEFQSNGRFRIVNYINANGTKSAADTLLPLFVGVRLIASGATGRSSQKLLRPPLVEGDNLAGGPDTALTTAITNYRLAMAGLNEINNRGEVLGSWDFDRFLNIGNPRRPSSIRLA